MVDPSTPTIGFVGLGNMGFPMATRLVDGGYALVVADARRDVTKRFLTERPSARSVNAPAELGPLCDVVITMLPNGRVVRDVVMGSADRTEAGVVATLKPRSVVIDMSSSPPQSTRDLGQALAKNGILLLDAPVSGGVKRARDGTLAIMVGGDADVIARCRPILETMGGQIFETGSLGSGDAMKALNNLVSAAGFIAAAEALLIGSRFGLSPEVIIDVLNASTGRNNSTENKFKQFVLSRSFDGGFSIGLMAKDIATATELAAQTGTYAPFGQACADLWREAEAMIGETADHTAVIRMWEEKIGKTLDGNDT